MSVAEQSKMRAANISLDKMNLIGYESYMKLNCHTGNTALVCSKLACGAGSFYIL